MKITDENVPAKREGETEGKKRSNVSHMKIWPIILRLVMAQLYINKYFPTSWKGNIYIA